MVIGQVLYVIGQQKLADKSQSCLMGSWSTLAQNILSAKNKLANKSVVCNKKSGSTLLHDKSRLTKLANKVGRLSLALE
jgi:hypothetical protein